MKTLQQDKKLKVESSFGSLLVTIYCLFILDHKYVWSILQCIIDLL